MEEMQAAAARPEVQQEMAQMAAVMQNKDLMDRMQQLKVRFCMPPAHNTPSLRHKCCNPEESRA
jgi:hypothetical protein